MKRQLWALTLAVGIALATSCSNGSPAAKAALLDAVEQTKSAESFHVESEIAFPDRIERGEADYVAPDRFRMQGSGAGAATTIHIGRDSYGTGPDNLSRFFHYTEPCEFGVETYFPAIAFAQLAEDVRRVGSTYVFELEGEGNPEGEARIEDGYLVSVVLRYDLLMMDGSVEERHTLSGFNSDIRIEPPPASRIEEDLLDGGVVSAGQGSAPDCSTVSEPPD